MSPWCIADFHHAVRACDQISELVHCLRTRLNPHDPASSHLPEFLGAPLSNIIIGMFFGAFAPAECCKYLYFHCAVVEDV